MILKELREENNKLKLEIERLRYQVKLLQKLHYGRKSEKITKYDESQASLFNEAEDEAFKQTHSREKITGIEKVEVASYKRRKKNQGRKKIAIDLPREEIIYDLSDEEKECVCGHKLEKIGEDISERADIIPAKIRVLKEVRYKYACKNVKCEGITLGRPGIVTAIGKKHIIPGGMATAGLHAWSINEKFEYGMPFYRQEKRLKYIGIPISRSTLCNWTISIAEKCKPLIQAIQRHIISGNIINADETHVQVLKEEGRAPETKSWMWVFLGGNPAKKAVLFIYDQNRSSSVPKQFLKDYNGILQTDDYSAYHAALKELKNEIVHILCWAHARRNFFRVFEAEKSENADKACKYINALFKLEELREGHSENDFLKKRNDEAQKILNEFKPWLLEEYACLPPNMPMAKAISYTLDNWEQLIDYLSYYEATPSNNSAENAIRPFVIGRKNWLFSDTPKGAESSAIMYSLIETAKRNNLNPYDYLLHIFEKLPYAEADEDFEKLLPFNLQQI